MKHRPSWIVFVVLGTIVCLGMGIWQLARYQEASGTVQNLGYTFMWPCLAGFLVYAYFKYIRLEADEAAVAGDTGVADSTSSDLNEVGAGTGLHRSAARGRVRRRGPAVTEIPAHILPARPTATADQAPDEGLRTYNTYLAELARRDGELGDRSQESPQA